MLLTSMMNAVCHSSNMLLFWIVILLILYRYESYPCYVTTVDSFKFLNIYRHDVQQVGFISITIMIITIYHHDHHTIHSLCWSCYIFLQQLHKVEGLLLKAGSSDDFNGMLSNNANDLFKKDDLSMNIWSMLQSSYDTLLKRDSKSRNDIDIVNSIIYESTTPSLGTFSQKTNMSSITTVIMNNDYNNNIAAIKAAPIMNSSASSTIIDDKMSIFTMTSRDRYQQASMSTVFSRYTDINNWNNSLIDTIRDTTTNNSMTTTTSQLSPAVLESNQSITTSSSSSSIALPIVADGQQRRGNRSSRLLRWSGNVKSTVQRLFRFKDSSQGSIVVMSSSPMAVLSSTSQSSLSSTSTSSTINSVIQHRQTSTSKYITTIASNSSVEPKKGFTLMIVRTIRRRLLNVLPRRRTSFEWANSVSSSGLYDIKDKPPRYYKISSANITQSTAVGMINTNSLISTIQKVNQKMRSSIRRRFYLSDTDDLDLESSDYMTQYLLSSSVSELAPSSSSLNVLGRNRVINDGKYDSYGSNISNDSENILTRIKNSIIKSLTFVSNARYVLYYNQNYLSTSNLNIKSDYRNALVVFNENNNNNNSSSSSTSVMMDRQTVTTTFGGTTSDIVKFYIDNVFDVVGAILDEYRESGYRSVEVTKEIINNTTSTMAQNKMLVESVNKVVMSEQSQNVVRGIGATKDTLQSIYLSGVEIAQESTDRFKSLATDNKWALPTIPVLSSFPSFAFLPTFPTIDIKSMKLPWDVYYRGDIPFFEIFNSTFQQSTSGSTSIPQLISPSISTRDIIASMIEVEKKLNDDKTLGTSTSSSSSSIIPLDSTDTSLSKGVKSRIIRMLFPVSSLALKGVKFVFSNRMENLTITADALRMRLDDQLQHLMTPSNQLFDNKSLQQQQESFTNPSNQSVDEDYSDLFTNDISAISTAWELAHPSSPDVSNAEESNERSSSVAFPKNIVVYSLRKLLISVPVYHVFNAYKYIRKMNRFRNYNIDQNEIVKLAIEDAKSVVVSDDNDDQDASISSDVSSEISLQEVSNV